MEIFCSEDMVEGGLKQLTQILYRILRVGPRNDGVCAGCACGGVWVWANDIQLPGGYLYLEKGYGNVR